MYRQVLTVPENLSKLREKSSPVDVDSAEASHIITDMLDTFRVLEGYGLAAPQIGIHKRVIVVSPKALGVGDEEALLMMNPVLKMSGEQHRVVEACFSVPYVHAYVNRYMDCTVSFTDDKGKERSLDLSGFPAACIQHEVDHLDGSLYLDRVSRLQRSLLLKKIQKAIKKKKKEEKERAREFMEDHMSLQYGDGTEKTKITYSKKRKAKARRKRKRSRKR